MGTILVIGILIILVALAGRSSLKHIRGEGGCCGGGAPVGKSRPKRLGRIVRVKRMEIYGMKCENCRRKVENALNSIPHVSAKVNLKKQEATIRLDEDIPDQVLEERVEELGYQVRS